MNNPRTQTRNYTKPPQNDGEDQSIVKSCKDLPYICPKCKSLLAFIDTETRSIVRIKFKDMYVYIDDAKQVMIPCRSCGYINTLNRIEKQPN